MSPELITLIGVGIALLTVQISAAGLLVILMIQSEKRINLQISQLRADTKEGQDQLRADMNRQHDQLRAEMKESQDQLRADLEQVRLANERQYHALDERVRGLEQGQGRLAGELSGIKDLITHNPPRQ